MNASPEQFSYVAAFLLGLMGSTHCLGMCGGYSASLSLSINLSRSKQMLYGLLFNSGRIFSYALLGLFIGLIGQGLANANENLPLFKLLRVISGFLLIAMALYISRIWTGLAILEKGGQKLWKLVAPLSKHVMPVKNPFQALGLGLLWGFLPCGLVYSSLAWSALSGNAIQSAMLMLLFGLGTVPAMFSIHIFASGAKQLLQKSGTRYAMAILLFVFGFWTIMGNTGSHHQHGEHTKSAEHSHHIHHQE